jgi:hypothetical protein
MKKWEICTSVYPNMIEPANLFLAILTQGMSKALLCALLKIDQKT